MFQKKNGLIGSGIKAGDNAWLLENNEKIFCHVLKVRGGTIKGYQEGNVLIEINGEKKAVLGSKLRPDKGSIPYS